ncbi:MAG: hypothetical protein HN758_07310 [Verrucomicrobia bacterium]|nr:hypothetical protein [Verrucomicrobiota bacterium]
MNASQKIHCPSCGIIIEFSSEQEGTTDACPSCNAPIWLSHLANEGDSRSTSKFESIAGQQSKQQSNRSHPVTTALLALLLLFNLLLGFQVAQLKAQIKKGIRPPLGSHLQDMAQIIPGSSSLVRQANTYRLNNATLPGQESIDILLELLEILDEDIRTEMTDLQTGVLTHSESINELMEVTGQLTTSMESTYENLSNVSTGLEQLSTRLAEVQDNQQVLQNILNQSR